MIEENLARIANALEALVGIKSATHCVGSSVQPDPMTQETETPKRRGRKSVEAAPAPAAQIDFVSEKPAADDFLTEAAPPPPPSVTKDDVRKALVDYSAKTNGEKARALMKEHGGVDTFGELKEENYRRVYEAAKKAFAAA